MLARREAIVAKRDPSKDISPIGEVVQFVVGEIMPIIGHAGYVLQEHLRPATL